MNKEKGISFEQDMSKEKGEVIEIPTYYPERFLEEFRGVYMSALAKVIRSIPFEEANKFANKVVDLYEETLKKNDINDMGCNRGELDESEQSIVYCSGSNSKYTVRNNDKKGEKAFIFEYPTSSNLVRDFQKIREQEQEDDYPNKK